MNVLRIGFLIVLLAVPALAEDSASRMRIEATGRVAAAPDMASVAVGVETRAESAAEALAASSARMKTVFKLLKARGISQADIQTSQFSLRPVWRDEKQESDKPLSIAGFVVANRVSVRIRNLRALGPVLDALSKAGANQIDSIRFSVARPRPLRDEARRRAVREALRRAELLATAAGRELGPILLIDTTNGGGMMPSYRLPDAPVAASVPIAEGEVTFNVTVTIDFALK